MPTIRPNSAGLSGLSLFGYRSPGPPGPGNQKCRPIRAETHEQIPRKMGVSRITGEPQAVMLISAQARGAGIGYDWFIANLRGGYPPQRSVHVQPLQVEQGAA